MNHNNNKKFIKKVKIKTSIKGGYVKSITRSM